jgi:sulfoxide reductase heme-binding subunit YedZ
MNISGKRLAIIKTILFLLCLVPLADLLVGVFLDTLGANPVETVTRSLGEWALRLLLLTLAITPLRRMSGWNWLLRLRRMLGLYSFFYVCLHLLSYIVADQFFDWNAIWKDIIKRPFITVGFASFVLLVPLAITSTNAMIKRLGGRRWLRLHQLVYAAAILGVLHFWWLVKKDITEPVFYGSVLFLLLGVRIYWKFHAIKGPAHQA